MNSIPDLSSGVSTLKPALERIADALEAILREVTREAKIARDHPLVETTPDGKGHHARAELV